jgi:NAD(P)-dependent dehydrogenase (short-subunit alcohol dehydrogenase family)
MSGHWLPRQLVTGGSRGLGRATALRLANLGVGVVLTYRSQRAEADRVVTDITDSGGTAVALQLDTAVTAGFEGLRRPVAGRAHRTLGQRHLRLPGQQRRHQRHRAVRRHHGEGLRRTFQAIDYDLTFEVAEVKVVSGDWAFLRTTSHGTVRILANGAQAPRSNHELFVLEKSHGRWRLACYSFSSALPSA